ncbi:helix-turn-helix domain-containing protein [Dermatophilaceae bacterium Sec6.4]
MGRSRQFSEAAAVAAAAALFRRQGYASTSIDDIVGATGVHRASLYSVFGSKYGLFVRALDEALARLSGSHDEEWPTGLDLVLIALVELAPSDAAVRQRLIDGIAATHLTASHLGERMLARAGMGAHQRSAQS